MSEVVTAWGKPGRLYTRCAFGPRFWYVPARWYGDLSLSFKGDRLVLIAISGKTTKRLSFDNGLAGYAERADVEKVLGEPSVRDPKDSSLYIGQIAYRAGSVRMDFSFESHGPSSPKDPLDFVAVRIEAEAQRDRQGEQDGAANRSQPVGSQTNQTSVSAGPGR